MPDGFVSLASWLRPEPSGACPAPAVEEIAAGTHGDTRDEHDASDDALAAARNFRMALDDALDTTVAALREEIAHEVLARELELSAPDLHAIVARARERYAVDEPLTIRVHPDDIAACAGLARVTGDECLRRGDVVLDLRCGTIDATLGARLDRLLAARIER